MKARIFKATVTIAVLFAGASLMPQSTHAQTTRVVAQGGGIVLGGAAVGALRADYFAKLVGGEEGALTKVPFFGKKMIKPLIKALNKGLPIKRTAKTNPEKRFQNWPYLEFTDGKHGVTLFNAGSYGGLPRPIIAFSYNGILKTTPSGWSQDGVWKLLPGMELHYPVILYRPTGKVFASATPVIPGNSLKRLPGRLGVVADKAAKVTRTVRMPAGALVLAGWKPTGSLADTFELLNFPPGLVYIMAGGGLDSFPPGGSVTGQDVDPVMQSWRSARSFAQPKKEQNEQFTNFTKWTPSAGGYIKLSVPGVWKNPFTMFDHASEAVDTVIMIDQAGGISSWGMIRNAHGTGKNKELVYSVEIPVTRLTPTTKPFGFTVAQSFKQRTLGDVVRAKVGMFTNLSRVDFLRKLAYLGGVAGGEGKMVKDLFGGAVEAVEKIRDAADTAIKKLPLDEIKVVNPKYVAYDPKTSSYPPSDSFSMYFAADNGITATGERGPMLITNSALEVFGERIAGSKIKMTLGTGLLVDNWMGGDISLGTVFGKKLNIEGKKSFKVEANLSHVIMENKLDLNILGIAKGQALAAFKLDKSGPKMRFVFDPTGGCAPPIPLKIDTAVKMPGGMPGFNKQIVDVISGVKFDSGGLMNCAGVIYDLGAQGVKYMGKGLVMGGEYVADGARYAAKYGAEGAKYAGKYAGVAGEQATKGYNTAVNAIGKGPQAVADFAAMRPARSRGSPIRSAVRSGSSARAQARRRSKPRRKMSDALPRHSIALQASIIRPSSGSAGKKAAPNTPTRARPWPLRSALPRRISKMAPTFLKFS